MNNPTLCPYELKNNYRIYDFKKSWRFLEQLGKNQFGPKFKLDPADRKIIYQLLIYFIRDEENCKKHHLDLDKGILLNGPVGCGKTSLMQLMRHFALPKHYVVKSTREIAAQFNIEGYSVIQRFGRSHQAIFCFDDLGVESNMKYYGTECNTISEILLQRYDLFIAHGTVTHATTNLNAQELEKLYGNRVRSRMREMFNLISFDKGVIDKRR
ncbi:ATPase [Parvicella tangerina]|uniref:ATPase n=1 Tax=Parvicella tangerina TaxID=2829795 RepID=A0A916NCZ4_9FLAO|nr:ATPase [Parvicella tangerina]CAG5086008.1 hypothetical protein CRYO30217_02974 [Parvicella tangerina]